MLTYINNLKISQKVYGGFGGVLALLAVVGGISLYTNIEIDSDFDLYDEYASDSILVSRVQGTLAENAQHALEWLRNHDASILEEVQSNKKSISDLLAETLQAIQHPERRQHLQNIIQANDDFYKGLNQIVSLFAERDKLVAEMNAIAPQIRTAITQVGEKAYSTNDYQTAAQAGRTNEALLLARLNAAQFLATNSVEDLREYTTFANEFKAELATLEARVNDRVTFANLNSQFSQYDAKVNKVGEVITKRNTLINDTILAASKTVETAIDGINATLVADTAAVKTRVTGLIHDATTQISFLSLISLLLGMGIAVIIARSILRPVSGIKETIVKLAAGDVKQSIPFVEGKDEIGEMARALDSFCKQAVYAFRCQSGVERATTNVMMADENLNIVFMNASQEKMLRAAEADLKKVLGNFDVSNLMGKNIDVFHKNPSHQRNLLANLTTSYSTQIKVGPRTFDLFANPAFSKSGQRLGTTIEWVDRTVELAIAEEIKQIIDGASKGNLNTRLNLDGKKDFFLDVSQGVNNLVEVVNKVVSDLAHNIKLLAGGDLTATITSDYEGLFKQLKDDFNATTEKLSEIMGNIKAISADVSDNADEMAEGSSGLASRAEQQASTLEETAASMEELTSTVKTNAESAKEASAAAINTRTIAEKGSKVANDAGHAMEKINESSRKITEIINVIDEIAFQTNLLALNAAVEAARAGDAGRGFAVVAQEVRTLAQRSAKSSKDIKALIDDSSKQVGDGVDLVKTAVTSLQQIYDAINGVSETVGQIASASSEQATSLDELNQAVMEMDSMTQQNASMAQQSRTVAQVMQEKSAELADMVSFFKIDEQDVERFTRRPANKSRPAPEPLKKPVPMKKPVAKVGKVAKASTVAAKHSDNDADWQEF